MRGQFADLTGHRFGRWVVLGRAENKGRNAAYFCKCDCGTERILSAFILKKGDSKSCGCFKKEINAEVMRKTMTTHGFTKDKKRIPLYHVWEMMHYRCGKHGKEPAYKDIKVCQEWSNFQVFFNWAIMKGYKKGLTIDRISPFGNYEPDNCRWITLKEQARNKRHHVMITVDGITKNTWEWEVETGIPATLIRSRILRGWNPKRAISESVNKR
jgi:hypothetical protein